MVSDRRYFDWKMYLTALAIQLIGAIVIYSTSRARFVDPELFGEFTQKYFLVLLFGQVAFLFGSLINYQKYRRLTPFIFGMAILLLLLTLNLPGETVKRWIRFGSFSFQTAEFAKLAFIMFFAQILSARDWDLSSLKNVALLSLLPLIPFFLVFKQPDLGTAGSFFILFFIILFWSGLQIELMLLIFSPLIGVFLILLFFGNYLVIGGIYSLVIFWVLLKRKNLKEAIVFLIINFMVFAFFPVIWQSIEPYQQQRILAFINPALDPGGVSIRYHSSKSIIAIASGGLIGKGLFKGPLTHLLYIPEQHTDFIFSVIGEEAGFLGAALVVILFLFLLFRMIYSIERAYADDFGNLIAVGIFGLFLFQITTNIFMAIGLFPVVGIPLPFMSYGGSSTVLFWFLLGLLQSINLNCYKEKYKNP